MNNGDKIMTTSIVKEVHFTGEYDGKFGTLYQFQVKLENNDFGQYSSKKQDQSYVVVGKSIDYEVDNTYPNHPKIKLVQGQNSGGGFSGGGSKGGFQKEDWTDKMIGISMGYAKDMFCAGKIDGKDLEAKFKKIFNIMNDFRNELKPKAEPTPEPQTPPPVDMGQPNDPPPHAFGDDPGW